MLLSKSWPLPREVSVEKTEGLFCLKCMVWVPLSSSLSQRFHREHCCCSGGSAIRQWSFAGDRHLLQGTKLPAFQAAYTLLEELAHAGR